MVYVDNINPKGSRQGSRNVFPITSSYTILQLDWYGHTQDVFGCELDCVSFVRIQKRHQALSYVHPCSAHQISSLGKRNPRLGTRARDSLLRGVLASRRRVLDKSA
jgi:hypothetical protein